MSLRFLHDGSTIGELDEGVVKLNLLGHAQMLELNVGSRCGGHGICGGDQVKISLAAQKKFFSAPTEIEKEHLSSEQLNEGWRLACQCFPNTRVESEEIVVEVLSVRS